MAIKDLIGRSDKAGNSQRSRELGADNTNPAALPVPRTVSPATSIDANTKLSGKLRCKETLRIDGMVKGEVRSDKSVIIGEGAKVDALVQGESVVISGEVKGDITAKRKITLESTARVSGELCTPGIVIEEGATVEGRILIGANPKQVTMKRPAAAAPRKSATPAAAAPSNGGRSFTT